MRLCYLPGLSVLYTYLLDELKEERLLGKTMRKQHELKKVKMSKDERYYGLNLKQPYFAFPRCF